MTMNDATASADLSTKMTVKSENGDRKDGGGSHNNNKQPNSNNNNNNHNTPHFTTSESKAHRTTSSVHC